MVNLASWKVVLILVVSALGVIFAAPNLLPQDVRDNLPSYLPSNSINLGLDLRGGTYVLMEVDVSQLYQRRLETTEDALRRGLRDEGVRFRELGLLGDGVTVTMREPGDLDAGRKALSDATGRGFEITVNDLRLEARLTEQEKESIREDGVQRVIEVLRRRVDEFGTTEPIIQRQGADRVLLQLPGLDELPPIDQTARLTFHAVDENANVADVQRTGNVPPGRILVPSTERAIQGGQQSNYVLEKRPILTGDNLTDAQATFQQGRPVVAFTFDTAGGRIFGRFTSNNIGRRMAIVLDNQVITAPRIRAQIQTNGVIEGNFTPQSAQDLALLLRAGALPADVTVIEQRTVGASLGADSIRAGEIAAVIAMVAVVLFMVLYYGLFGLFANLALFINMAMIAGALSLLQATLTLPGIAGIVLTIGMAVDANVLIFERIREEADLGRTPISAIDAGYQRAMTTIVDANLTTLIAALLLFQFGTGPIKGFAVTLAIGVLTSMFTAIMLTRLMVVTWLRRRRPQSVPL
jgi:preprotein translocase subunit SecD